jgi:endonuclease/exonuclease/phosphatase family metal-dependent hydrolase
MTKLNFCRPAIWMNKIVQRRSLVSLLLSLTIFLGMTLGSDGVAIADEPMRLRILSYNIHHAEGVDQRLDVARIAKVIQSVRPDIVALQEVDQHVQRTNGVDQPAELAQSLEMQVVFGANIELQGGHYGNAILSRFPIVEHQNHLLPLTDGGEQRGVLEARIALPRIASPLLFLATHFDHRREHQQRIDSVQAIHQLVESSDVPAILAGDLNATRDSQPLKLLETAWSNVNTTPLPTIPVDAPQRQIDFVLYRPADMWNVIEVKVLDEAVASDHRAIYCELEWVGK